LVVVLGFTFPVPMGGKASAIQSFTPAEILAVMERAADWQLAHPSVHPATDWTQGAGGAGMMALAGISGSPTYRDAMWTRGRTNGWKLGPTFYDADGYCIGQTYAELFLLYRDNKMIAPLRQRFDAILAQPSPVTSLEFAEHENRPRQNWSWCDALFMGPPTWLRLYAATDDTRYLNFAVTNWWRTTDYLYDRDEHLYFRDSTYFPKREANGKKVFWSRGNGWVMAGLVRVLQYLPMNHPDRPRFERMFKEMAEKILTCQQPDGLWRASLLDPKSYPLKETSGSGFYTYALAWGVNQELLDRAKFEPAVHHAWTALVDCVEADGKLTHVQPIGADPKKFEEGSTEIYGVGAFLLAGSEVYRLAVFGQFNGKSRPVVVNITNPSSLQRDRETIELDQKTFPPQLATRPPIPGHFAIMEGVSSRILDSQAYASEPGCSPDKLLFQVDLVPGETRIFYILDASALAAIPQPLVKTYARQITERFKDLAWESDCIGHRTYQLDLIQGEGTVSSGIDVWCKRTRDPVINSWYKNGDYHNDHGEGLDDYHVGRSRGCGGLGIWDGKKLHVSLNYRDARLITTGPIRSEFELTYDAWDAGGRKVSETKRIRIDAGSNLSRAESVFTSDDPSSLQIGVGIAQRPGEGLIQENQTDGWMTYWQPADRDRGNIGCAVIFPAGGIKEFVTETATVPKLTPVQLTTPDNEGLPPVANLLAIVMAEPRKPFVYWLGAGWSRSGDFLDGKSWENYVRRFVERLRAPLQVTLESK
jgi:unsaturated rhamnogalacturonyl hydrolase